MNLHFLTAAVNGLCCVIFSAASFWHFRGGRRTSGWLFLLPAALWLCAAALQIAAGSMQP